MTQVLGITQLRSFVEIADSGGFGRAAEALYISQPTVSQHVRQLEQVVGNPLVERQGRRAVFTRFGERLLVEARAILRAHDGALSRLDAAVQQPAIVIGSTETAADELLPDLLATVKGAFPDRPVRFRIGRSTGMSTELDRGEIDVAVLLGFEGGTPGTRVGSLPLRWFAAPTLADQAHDKALPLVAYTEPCGMRQRALSSLSSRGVRVDLAAESGTLEGVIAGARAGLGIAVIPSAGRVPHGLIELHDLPDLGEISVHIAARRGVDPAIVSAATGALDGFFEPVPVSGSSVEGASADTASSTKPIQPHLVLANTAIVPRPIATVADTPAEEVHSDLISA